MRKESGTGKEKMAINCVISRSLLGKGGSDPGTPGHLRKYTLFSLSEKVFIFPSFLKDSIARYRLPD